MFRDRQEAGRALAAKLRGLEGERPVVLGLPRGGLPVAVPVAEALNAPLDFVNVRKIGAPGRPELGIGAVVGGDPPVRVLDERLVGLLGVGDAFIRAEEQAQLRLIARRAETYRRGRPPVAVAGRTVVLVDDGIATGGTMRAAIRALRFQGAARIIVAVPVGPPEALAELLGEADKVVWVVAPADFTAVGAEYRDFDQVDDAEVIAILDRFAHRADTREQTDGRAPASDEGSEGR